MNPKFQRLNSELFLVQKQKLNFPTMQIFHQKIFYKENKSELQLMKKLPLSKSSAVPYSPKNYQNYTMKRKNLQKVANRYC